MTKQYGDIKNQSSAEKFIRLGECDPCRLVTAPLVGLSLLGAAALRRRK